MTEPRTPAPIPVPEPVPEAGADAEAEPGAAAGAGHPGGAGRTALVVVDVQNDFCEGGSLAVSGGAAVAAGISELLATGPADVVVATRDHHIDPGGHFAAEPDFVDTWPPHCVAGTPGADFHPALDTTRVEAVFHKGHRSAAYSGFEGVLADHEPGSAGAVGLADWLTGHGVGAVDVVGIATDHCVRATALDAVRAGFRTRVLLDHCAGVAPDTTADALAELEAAGVELVGAGAGAGAGSGTGPGTGSGAGSGTGSGAGSGAESGAWSGAGSGAGGEAGAP